MKINKGSTRNVLVFRRFVVKIPTLKEYRLFLNGILANLQEKEWSGHHPDLAKVIFCTRFGLFLVMEKAEVVSNNTNWQSFQTMIKEKYKDDDLKEFITSDTKPSNWGYVKNHLVKIDYGN